MLLSSVSVAETLLVRAVQTSVFVGFVSLPYVLFVLVVGDSVISGETDIHILGLN
jgi:hypothetical protein